MRAWAEERKKDIHRMRILLEERENMIHEAEEEQKVLIKALKEKERESKEVRAKAADLERQLHIERLLYAQGQLANLDLKVKTNVLRMGNLQLVSRYALLFISIYQIIQEKNQEELKAANEDKLSQHTELS